ncbi:MAG: hypothetical protein Q9223_004780 [Gallowayella weberi]
MPASNVPNPLLGPRPITYGPRLITYDVPGTLVRITLSKLTGHRIPSASVPAFFHLALISLAREAAQAGGPTAPMESDRRKIGYKNYGLDMELNDVTYDHPEAGGGRLRYDEVKAVYEGVDSAISLIGYEDCVIEGFRMVRTRTAGLIAVRVLVSGYLVDTYSAGRAAARLELNRSPDRKEQPA